MKYISSVVRRCSEVTPYWILDVSIYFSAFFFQATVTSPQLCWGRSSKNSTTKSPPKTWTWWLKKSILMAQERLTLTVGITMLQIFSLRFRNDSFDWRILFVFRIHGSNDWRWWLICVDITKYQNLLKYLYFS